MMEITYTNVVAVLLAESADYCREIFQDCSLLQGRLNKEDRWFVKRDLSA